VWGHGRWIKELDTELARRDGGPASRRRSLKGGAAGGQRPTWEMKSSQPKTELHEATLRGVKRKKVGTKKRYQEGHSTRGSASKKEEEKEIRRWDRGYEDRLPPHLREP